ncbi:F-box domain containing protein [Tanacetum coccineum]
MKVKRLSGIHLLENHFLLGSVNGVVGFDEWHKGDDRMVVLWNPSIRKAVRIPIFNVLESPYIHPIGLGVCPDTNDPVLVKIEVVETPSLCWVVQVFTLSSCVWNTGAPFKPCRFMWDYVFVDGIHYWSRCGTFIISFDVKSENLGQVCIPERLLDSVTMVKLNESLGLLEYNREGGMRVCGVWMRKDNNPFTKIFTVKVEGHSLFFDSVLGFRNNGEVVIAMADEDLEESQIEVYEPSSGRTNSVGISGQYATFSVWSHIETLLLLDFFDSEDGLQGVRIKL